VRLPGWFAAGGRDAFMLAITAALAASRALTAALQNGSLQRYLTLLVCMALAAGAWPFLHGPAANRLRCTCGISTRRPR
jgi:hypothetical protein